MLLSVVNPYSYASIYKENQGLVILSKNKLYIVRKKSKKSFKIPKEAGKVRRRTDNAMSK